MRNITSLLFALFIMACGAHAQVPNPIPWPIEPKTERVQQLLFLESVNYELMGDPRDTESNFIEVCAEIAGQEVADVEGNVKEVYNEAVEAWRQFVWLCNEGREKEAIEFYSNDPLIVDIALTHSIVRFTFHEEVIDYMAYEYLDVLVAEELMMRVLGFDFTMISATHMMGANDEYIEVIDYLFELLIGMYHDNGRYDDIINLCDLWLNNTVRDEDKAASVYVYLTMAHVYHYEKGDSEEALKCAEQAKTIIEDLIKQGEFDDELQNTLVETNSFISFLRSK